MKNTSTTTKTTKTTKSKNNKKQNEKLQITSSFVVSHMVYLAIPIFALYGTFIL
jgi:hypothetical protein